MPARLLQPSAAACHDPDDAATEEAVATYRALIDLQQSDLSGS
jgi:hypothetical protein